MLFYCRHPDGKKTISDHPTQEKRHPSKKHYERKEREPKNKNIMNILYMYVDPLEL